MCAMDLAFQSLAMVSDLLSTGDITSVELTEICLSQINSSDSVFVNDSSIQWYDLTI